MNIQLQLLPESFSIFKVNNFDEIPVDTSKSIFSSVTQSNDEICVLCQSNFAPEKVRSEWRFLRYSGSLEDNAMGIVAAITKPLSDTNISVLVNTTFDYGYFGVELDRVDDAINTFCKVGISVKAGYP